MIDLDLMSFKDELKVRTTEGKRYIFDPHRKKWLVLQPEELVRQLVIQYLLTEKNYRASHMAVERMLKVNKLTKRCDILMYDLQQQPFLLVECKAPAVKIDQGVFRQIAWYNMPLKVQYLMVTNGITTYCCAMDYEQEDYSFLTEIPEFSE